MTLLGIYNKGDEGDIMKTQQECWEALIAGKTLVNVYGSCSFSGIKVKLTGGFARNVEGSIDNNFSFSNPDWWEVYEPKYTMEQIKKAYNDVWTRKCFEHNKDLNPNEIEGIKFGTDKKPSVCEIKQELEKLNV